MLQGAADLKTGCTAGLLLDEHTFLLVQILKLVVREHLVAVLLRLRLLLGGVEGRG